MNTEETVETLRLKNRIRRQVYSLALFALLVQSCSDDSSNAKKPATSATANGARLLTGTPSTARDSRERAIIQRTDSSDPGSWTRLQELPDADRQRVAIEIATGFVQNGDLIAASRFLNEAFSLGGRSKAIIACIESFGSNVSPDEAVEFWSLLRDEGTTDQAAGAMAGYLAKADPVQAINWYFQLSSKEAKRLAKGELTADSQEGIRAQIAAVDDNEMAKSLAGTYGGRLRVETSPAEVGRELKLLPETLRKDAELAYVNSLAFNVGGLGRDKEGLEWYAAEGLTAEGRDQAAVGLANIAFNGNPKRGLDIYLASGVSERKPDSWKNSVRTWLRSDSRSASTYILGLPPGPSRTSAIETLVDHLQEIGDQEAADAWKAELPLE